MDSLASNFNPNANVNNGSCIYSHLSNLPIQSESLIIFPNPANDYIKISSVSGIQYHVKIYSNEGKLIIVDILKKELTISLNQLAEGNYKLLLEGYNDSRWFTFNIQR
jgi:hypothetical protein